MFILFYLPSNRILSLACSFFENHPWLRMGLWSSLLIPGLASFFKIKFFHLMDFLVRGKSSLLACLQSWDEKNASNAKIDQIVCGNNFPFRE